MKVIHFHRRSHPSYWSIEKIFGELRQHLPPDIVPEIKEMPHPSQGIVSRIRNLAFTWNEQEKVNHITGDIHYIALGLRKKGSLLTIHDLGFMDQYKGLTRKMLWLFWIYLPVRRVQKVVAISEVTRQEIIRYARCRPDKVLVIPDFISPLFVPHPKKFREDCPSILQIGTKFNKNIERLIMALENIPCRLILVGQLSTAQEDLLHKHHIHYETRFRLTEAEIVALYRECDLVSFCSLLEGFGLPILEAQATGRVVVTSQISSMPEVAGAGACLVNPLDPASIREGILKVIREETYRNHLIRQGFENIKRYTVDRVAEDYARLYREMGENA